MSLKSEKTDFFELYLSEELAKIMLADISTNVVSQKLSVNLSGKVTSSNDTIDSENVVAVIKGSEKPSEYVIISSHLDHIGITADGQINNGADDDGSGTVALLEIAEAFKKAADEGNGPKRSIVFLHVTGEEKGLLGSKYYTDSDPVFPLNQTVANLNIDMIGRIDPKRTGDRNYIYLIGSDKLSTELHDFAKNNIPIIFYFNGTHDDYHRPTDTPDKIEYDLLENRSRLVFHTAWEVANRNERLIVDKASE